MKKPAVRSVETFMLPAAYRVTEAEIIENVRAEGDGKARTFRMVMSTEAPARSYNYPEKPALEVLSHAREAVDMSLMEPSAPLHAGHTEEPFYQHGPQVGVAENARIENRRMVGEARFSRSVRGQEAQGDVEDEISRFVSVGYRVLKARRLPEPDAKTGMPVYEAVRWQPFEVSIVGLPADRNAVIVRKDAQQTEHAVELVEGVEGPPPTQASTEAEPAKPAESAADAPEGPAPENTEVRSMKKVRDEKGAVIEVADDDPRQAVREDGRSKTQTTRDEEVAKIYEICDEHGLGGKAPEYVRSGMTYEAVCAALVEARRTPRPQVAAGGPESEAEGIDLGLKTTDQQRFSYARAVLMASGDVPENGIEAEVNQELARKLTASGLPFRGNGVLLPFDLRTRQQRYDDYDRRIRAMAARTLAGTGTGAEVVFDRPGELIELLRNRSVLISMGARVLSGLTGPVPFPIQDSAGTFSWVGENPGADVADSDLGLGLRTLSPKTGQSSTSYSRQLLIQASVDVENLVRNDLAAIHGLGIDKAGLHGQSAAGQPTGLYFTGGNINTQDYGSTVPTYALLVNQAALVADDNADLGSLGWITTPLMAGKLKTTPEHSTAGMANWIWQGTFRDGTLAGYRAMGSNQCSKTMTGTAGAETGGNDHAIFFGNWNDMIVGLFGALEIVVDPYAKKKRGLIEVTSFQMADILVRHAESFSVSTQARTS
jgi:HK97 family phage major capsid protein